MKFFTGFRPTPPEDYRESGLASPPDAPQYTGVVFDDGSVSVRWLTAVHSFSNFDSYEDWEKVHYHPEYGTYLEWLVHDYDGPAWEKADLNSATDF